MSVLVPAGFIALNQFSFPFLSTKNIKNAKARMLIAAQMVVHEGVALILEIPQSGLVANPKPKRIAAIKIKMTSIFMVLIFMVFSENLRYKTAQITPRIVIEEFDALPSPKESIKWANVLVNTGP